MDLRDSEPDDPIFILACLRSYMTSCDALRVHEDAAVWTFKALLQEAVDDTLIMRVTSTDKVGQAKDGNSTTYSDEFIYLLENYASEDVIAEAKGNRRPLVRTLHMIPTDYVMLLSRQVFRCGPVYSKSRILGIYIEGLE